MLPEGSQLGRSVFYALTPNKGGASYCPTFDTMLPSTDNVKSIAIDLGLAQLNVFQPAYPEATVLFCRFHVLMDMFHRCGSPPVTVEGDGKRIHQWMCNLFSESKKEDFDRFDQ